VQPDLAVSVPAGEAQFASDDDLVESRLTGLLAAPSQRRCELPGPCVLQPPAGEHSAVVIDDHNFLNGVGQIDPADRPVTRHDLSQPLAPVVATRVPA
jgi:hypothetical protein